MQFIEALVTSWALVILLIAFGLTVVAVELENAFVGISVVVLTAFLFGLFGYEPLSWIVSNPFATLSLFVAYAAAGGVWSFIKWWLYVRKNQDLFQMGWNHYKDLHLRGAASAVPKMEDFLESSYNPFLVSQNKNRIIAWMSLWPASIFWTLLSDVVREVWNWIYEKLSAVYDRIMRNAAGSLKE